MSALRGFTSKQIIQLVRDAGAHKAYFASAAAPARFPNFYGIDMPSAGELATHDRREAQAAANVVLCTQTSLTANERSCQSTIGHFVKTSRIR
jgi:glutamine phosphoribosylpyrophosphate amidotransferase